MDTIPSAPSDQSRALADFVDRLVADLEPLQRRSNESVWMASITGSPDHQEESARLETEIRTRFARPEPFEFLKRLDLAGITDPLLARQAFLLLQQFRAHQIPAAAIERMVRLEKGLDSRFNNFRADLGGERVTDNRLRQILRTSNDTALRRRAWEASKQIGAEVAEDLLELVRLRNQAARDLGFGNYYTMMLELDELDETELFAVLDDLERGTRPLFERYRRELDQGLSRRFGTPPGELMPWHYGDPFFQEAPAAEYDLDPWFRSLALPELTERFFGAVGFDVRELMERADLFEKPGKSQHAFCLSVDRGRDIRVLCNVQPNEFWMSTLLHEFGHAVYDQTIDPALPYLLRTPAHTLTTEASAMLFGRLSKNAAWLRRWAGMDEAEARRADRAIGRAIRAQLLVMTRWCLVMCHMERAVYRDPAQDLSSLWWDLVERFQLLRRPPDRRAPDWASKIHFSVAPVYYHNYMLGEIMASQLEGHLMNEVLGGGPEAARRYVAAPELGSDLEQRLYRPGKSVDWREAIRRSTGRPLGAAAFVAGLEDRG
jgi:peptidyl-dipeptidase A